MTIADKINWTLEYLTSKRFDRLNLNDIVEAYVSHCENKSIEIEDRDLIYGQIKACLSKLVKDGYVTMHDFLEEPTYSVGFHVGFLSTPEYYLPTQEEIDEKERIKELNRQKEIQAKKERRRERIKWVLKKSWGIIEKYWYAVVVPIVVLFIWEIWLKPWINGQGPN